MHEHVEIESLDLRYGSHRLKSTGAEKMLLVSISEKGIREPLQGVTHQGDRILLNGFKRYRCARKLNIGTVPYVSLSSDTAEGILKLLRISNEKSLNILEQASLIDELIVFYKMSNAEIAEHLEKSKAWVSVRTGIIREMSDVIKEKVFSGKFPIYSYMYTVRQFMRINSVKKEDVDQFVSAVSGKGLSTRNIEVLANGYFKGGEELRQQIRNGNISWGLERLKETSIQNSGCTVAEQRMLKNLEIVQKYMQRTINGHLANQFNSGSFRAQANLVTDGILRIMEPFSKTIGQLNDISRKTQSDLSPT